MHFSGGRPSATVRYFDPTITSQLKQTHFVTNLTYITLLIQSNLGNIIYSRINVRGPWFSCARFPQLKHMRTT